MCLVFDIRFVLFIKYQNLQISELSKEQKTLRFPNASGNVVTTFRTFRMLLFFIKLLYVESICTFDFEMIFLNVVHRICTVL